MAFLVLVFLSCCGFSWVLFLTYFIFNGAAGGGAGQVIPSMLGVGYGVKAPFGDLLPALLDIQG